MIYTLTLNPAIDYNAFVTSAVPKGTNRTENEYIVPGGKGLNVSVILSRFGIENTALGFAAGFSGNELKRLMEEQGCKCDFIDLEQGFTRINVKLIKEGVTEFNGSGAKISEGKFNMLLKKISDIGNGDTLVLCGSIPKGLGDDTYCRIAGTAKSSVRLVIDTSGTPLLKSLKCRPFLIKPNIDELSDIFGVKITSLDKVFEYAKKLKDMGAENVMVSLGEKGAVLLDSDNNRHCCSVPKGTPINTVGAGDSMIAAFIAKYDEQKDYNEALRFAVAAGSATSYSSWLGRAEDIYSLYSALL